MQRAREYVEHLKRKPSHERERIAFLSAGAVALVVTLGYLGALMSSDRLAVGTPSAGFAAENAGEDFSDLLGAAAAFNSRDDDGELTVVESSRSSTFEREDAGAATVIPF